MEHKENEVGRNYTGDCPGVGVWQSSSIILRFSSDRIIAN